MLHVHIWFFFFARNIFCHEYRGCYHVAFVGSAQYSILQCLAQAKSFFVKYAAYHKQCMQVVMGCECVGQGEANADKLDCCTCLELQVRCWLRRDTLHSSLLVWGASCSSEIALIQLLPLIWQCISWSMVHPHSKKFLLRFVPFSLRTQKKFFRRILQRLFPFFFWRTQQIF